MKRLFALAMVLAALLAARHAWSQEPEAPPPEAPDEKAQAEERFYKGLRLFREQLWDAALAEFLESRAMHATRAATRNAALCLRKLGRFDEALDLFEAMLREFPPASAEER